MQSKDKEQFVNGWLAAALKHYGQAEPRAGLENRVLAAMRAEREQRTQNWKWWPALAAGTAILTIAACVFMAKSEGRKTHSPIAKNHTVPVEVSRTNTNPASKPHIEDAANQKPHFGAPRRSLQIVHASATARLEQFPSPEPLSEQEKILARYVQQFPHEAHLMAQVQTELAREGTMAEQAPPESDFLPGSELQNQ